MEAARRVFGDEARLIQVIHPQTPLEALAERVGLWKEFHILSPLFPLFRVTIDERLGRRIAEYLGLNVTGTLGVLAKAKSAGLIQSFHEAAQALRQQGIHCNAGLISRVALHLGEDPGSN